MCLRIVSMRVNPGGWCKRIGESQEINDWRTKSLSNEQPAVKHQPGYRWGSLYSKCVRDRRERRTWEAWKVKHWRTRCCEVRAHDNTQTKCELRIQCTEQASLPIGTNPENNVKPLRYATLPKCHKLFRISSRRNCLWCFLLFLSFPMCFRIVITRVNPEGCYKRMGTSQEIKVWGSKRPSNVPASVPGLVFCACVTLREWTIQYFLYELIMG